MKTIYIFCISIFLPSCAAFKGTPENILNMDKTIERSAKSLETLADNPPKECPEIKSGVNQALTAIDLRYAEFIDSLSIENKTKATATDFAIMGLGLAGTAVGGAGVKTILHAISTGVAAANTSIDKNYFYEKTIPPLVSQMNADRMERLSMIVQRLNRCEEDKYSWFEAVHDLTDYYSAGTLLGAITSIPKDAGARQTDAEEEIKDVLKFKRSPDNPEKELLRVILRKSGGVETIMSCWNKVNPGLFNDSLPKSKCGEGLLSPARLINAAECSQDQAPVLDCLSQK